MNRTRFALVLLVSSGWLGVAGVRGVSAQPVPLGPEIEVPGFGFPARPLLAVQPGGAYVVAWDQGADSREELYYRYVAAGKEPAQVGPATIESPEIFPEMDAVTATPKGFDLLWHVPAFGEPAAFYRRHLNLQGVPDGQPVRLGGNGTAWVWQVRGNGFMAGWPLPNRHGIAARHLSSAGRLSGPELRLNSRPVDRPRNPIPLAVADGGFVAVWTGTVPGPTATRVLRARRFSPAAKPLGPDFDVNTTSLGVGSEANPPFLDPAFQVAAAPGGGFAVAWRLDSTIYLRFFDATGQALGPEIPAALGAEAFSASSLAFDDGGNLMLLWLSETDLRLQLFDSHGAPLGPSVSVRSEASDIFQEPLSGSVIWAGDSWLVTWKAVAVTTHDFSTLFVRRFR